MYLVLSTLLVCKNGAFKIKQISKMSDMCELGTLLWGAYSC